MLTGEFWRFCQEVKLGPSDSTGSPRKAGEDQREYFRVNALLPLSYGLEGEPERSPKLTQLNISGGGLCFETERRFNPGDCLDIMLVLPSTPPIRTKAKVVRVSPLTRKVSAQSVATGFTTITDKDRESLIRYITHVQIKQVPSGHHK